MKLEKYKSQLLTFFFSFFVLFFFLFSAGEEQRPDGSDLAHQRRPAETKHPRRRVHEGQRENAHGGASPPLAGLLLSQQLRARREVTNIP